MVIPLFLGLPTLRSVLTWGVKSAGPWENRRSLLKPHKTIANRAFGGVPVDVRVIWERDGRRCHICQKPIALEMAELDHVFPLARLDPDNYHLVSDPNNARVAHSLCNKSRSAYRPGQMPLRLIAVRNQPPTTEFSDDAFIEEVTCLKCNHSWWPSRPGVPKRCARCKSPYWNVPKKLRLLGEPEKEEP